jgi:hypothetical protein
MTVSAVEGIFGTEVEQELKKLASGIVVAEAARLAALIFLIKSLRVFRSFIALIYKLKFR